MYRLVRPVCAFPAGALGIEVSTAGGNVSLRVPQEKLERLHRQLDDLADHALAGSRQHRRTLAGVVGLLSFVSRAVPAGRSFLRSLYRCLHDDVAGDCEVSQ